MFGTFIKNRGIRKQKLLGNRITFANVANTFGQKEQIILESKNI